MILDLNWLRARLFRNENRIFVNINLIREEKFRKEVFGKTTLEKQISLKKTQKKNYSNSFIIL